MVHIQVECDFGNVSNESCNFKKGYKRITKNNINGDMRFGEEKLRMV